MRVLDHSPAPYATRLTATAAQQLARLPREKQDRARNNLLQLADLAAFAAGYSMQAGHLSSLVADAGGISIRYHVDDRGRSITVLEVETL
jgi:mRNA-degrading endonuclease RelE of RelBE toxin-antitoxin system